MSAPNSDNSEDNHVTEPPLWEELFPSEYANVAGWVVLIVSVLFIIMGTIPQMMYGYPKSPNELGDTFGVVNALFSGLGFAGLFITILIQIREFRLAQQERMDALRIQKEVSDQHAKNIRIQRKISKQQEVSSLIQSVATWTAMNPSRALYKSYFTQTEVKHLYFRFTNIVILNTTQADMLKLDIDYDGNPRSYRKRKSDLMKLSRFYFEIGDMIIRETNSFLEIDHTDTRIRDLRQSCLELTNRMLVQSTHVLDRYQGVSSLQFRILKHYSLLVGQILLLTQRIKLIDIPPSVRLQSPDPELERTIRSPFQVFKDNVATIIGEAFLFYDWEK